VLPSWRNTLVERRGEAEKLFDDGPSLRPQLRDLRDEAYPDSVRDAVNETGLHSQRRPGQNAHPASEVAPHPYIRLFLAIRSW